VTNKFNAFVPYLFAALAALFLGFVIFVSSASFAKISDLPEYYATARQVLDGHGPETYDVAALTKAEHELFPEMQAENRFVAFLGLPLALPWLVPIGLIPLPAAIVVWKAIQIIALLSALILISMTYGIKRETTAWLFAWVLISGPAFEALRIDQIAPLLLFAFSLAIVLIEKNRPLYAGLALAFLFIKPQELIPILVILLGVKEYATVLFSLMWAAVVGAAAFLMLGTKAFYNYKALVDLVVATDTFTQSNLSPTVRGQLLRILPEARHSVEVIASVVMVGGLILIYFVAKRFAQNTHALRLAIAYALPIGLVISLHCHDYDLLLLIPGLITLKQNFAKLQKLRALAYLGCLAAVPFVIPVYASIHYDYLLKGAMINPIFIALLAYSLMIIPLMLANQRQLET
jgi:hypothetical protein